MERPADIRVIWEKNGHEAEMCVPVQTLTLPDGRAHVLSWLRDALRESADYRCSVLSSAGSRASSVRVSVLRHEMTQQEKWTRELAAWRAMVGEHDRMLQDWRKAWALDLKVHQPVGESPPEENLTLTSSEDKGEVRSKWELMRL